MTIPTETPSLPHAGGARALAAPVPRRRIPNVSGGWRGIGVGLVVLVAGLSVPYLVTGAYSRGILLDAVILSFLALGIGFLARHLGLISLGHTAFFGSAAYLVAIATTRWGWSPTAAALLGVTGGTVLALLVGALVVRATGMGFLMLTLAFGQALYQLCVQTSVRPVTGAYDGLQVRHADQAFFGLPRASVTDAGLFWPCAWGALVVCVVALWLVGRSEFGTRLEGIRENAERMRFSGFDTFLPRLGAFVLSGAVAALGGALFAVHAGYVSPDVLGFQRAGDALIATIVGGAGTLLGPMVGATAFIYVQAHFNSGGNLHLYTGIALVLVLAFMPGGLTGMVGQGRRRMRLRLGTRRAQRGDAA